MHHSMNNVLKCSDVRWGRLDYYYGFLRSTRRGEYKRTPLNVCNHFLYLTLLTSIVTVKPDLGITFIAKQNGVAPRLRHLDFLDRFGRRFPLPGFVQNHLGIRAAFPGGIETFSGMPAGIPERVSSLLFLAQFNMSIDSVMTCFTLFTGNRNDHRGKLIWTS